jgi:flagellar motor switch protein FliM
LRVRHEDLVVSLATRLSIHLGLEVVMQMAKLEAMTYHTFAEGLTNPTFTTMLKAQPLTGIGLLDIPPRLGLSIVDRELGGPGRVAEDTSQIGKVETRLLSTVVHLIVNEWCAVWKDLMELQPSVLGHEMNSRYLDTSDPDTTMLVVGVETHIGDLVEMMQFAFPHHMLEPLTLKLNASAAHAEKPGATTKNAPLKWNPFFDDVDVQVRAELPEIQVPGSQVAELKVGDIVPLPPECMTEVRLRLANHPGFIGTLGISNQRRAVKIDKCLKR